MTHEKMQEYNQLLVSQKIELTLVEYITEANSKLLLVDMEFMEEFMDLVGRDDFCIPHELLYKYGALTERDSHVIKRALEQYEFVEEKDYQVTPTTLRGSVTKNIYMLLPETFKYILIRSLKQRKYADYYLMLEKCVKYYNEYQIQLLKAKVVFALIEF